QEGDMGLFAVGANGEAIGIVQLRYKSCLTESYSEYPELAIAVAPAYHGQGIASALMRELLERIDVTVKGIRLGVHPKNTVAMALYKKFGFKVYDTGKNGFPQLVMKVNT
ncbi:GNAT family N-acetyltransferase, partial [Photobacterium sanctipauli]